MIPQEKKELARAMVRAGQSYREVAQALDISRTTVFNAMKTIDMDVTALAKEVRGTLAAKSLVIGDYILNRIGDYAIDDAGLKEKAIAAAIFMDKAMDLEKIIKMDKNEQPKIPDSAPESKG